jgi:hypothetical protein
MDEPVTIKKSFDFLAYLSIYPCNKDGTDLLIFRNLWNSSKINIILDVSDSMKISLNISSHVGVPKKFIFKSLCSFSAKDILNPRSSSSCTRK